MNASFHGLCSFVRFRHAHASVLGYWQAGRQINQPTYSKRARGLFSISPLFWFFYEYNFFCLNSENRT
jgi:hypothetical protein